MTLQYNPVTQSERSLEASQSKGGRNRVPAVDIFETDEGLTLMADLPGVNGEGLDVDIDKGILTLRGKVQLEKKEKCLFAEFTGGDYYRQFQLPDHIDIENVAAELQDGVLVLSLPKAAAAKPRKIEISTA